MPFFSSTLGLNQENGRTTRAQTAVPVKTTALSTAPTTQTTRQVMENISNRVVQARTDATVGKTRSATRRVPTQAVTLATRTRAANVRAFATMAPEEAQQNGIRPITRAQSQLHQQQIQQIQLTIHNDMDEEQHEEQEQDAHQEEQLAVQEDTADGEETYYDAMMDTDSTHVEAPAHAAAAVATSAALPALDRCVSIAPAPEQTEQTVPPHLHHHQQVGKSSAMAPLARHATFASWPAANAAAAAVNARASQSTLISAAQARLSNAVKPTRPIPAGVPNLDEEDYDLSLMYVPEYAAEIYEYLNNLQHVYAINPTYLSRQPEITARMRSILVGWLFQVHQTWPFKQETLYLAVHVLDRFLQRRQVPRTRLQLIGLTSFIIAAKYEEIYIPEITEFVALTHNLFSSQDVLVAESEILVALGFNLGTPSPLHFLRRGYRASPCRPKTYTFAKYMCELSLYSAEMLEFPQSTIAGAALFVSRRITSPTEVAWDDSMQFYLFTPYEAMLRCARTLLELLRVAHTDNVYEAVYNRFRDEANQRVSRIPLNAEKLELVFKDI